LPEIDFLKNLAIDTNWSPRRL